MTEKQDKPEELNEQDLDSVTGGVAIETFEAVERDKVDESQVLGKGPVPARDTQPGKVVASGGGNGI